MKTQSMLIAAGLFAMAATAGAFEATQFPNEPSTLTRAEVKAELARARANGELSQHAEWRAELPAARRAELPPTAGRTREEVRREAARAARAPMDPRYVGG
jgi:hypothetical protein